MTITNAVHDKSVTTTERMDSYYSGTSAIPLKFPLRRYGQLHEQLDARLSRIEVTVTTNAVGDEINKRTAEKVFVRKLLKDGTMSSAEALLAEEDWPNSLVPMVGAARYDTIERTKPGTVETRDSFGELVDAFRVATTTKEAEIQAFAKGTDGIAGGPLVPGMLLVREGKFTQAYAPGDTPPSWHPVDKEFVECAYCGHSYPRPVSTHHTNEECDANRAAQIINEGK